MSDARARASDAPARRERYTEAVAALGFAGVALAMASSLESGPVPVTTAACLVGLYFVLHQVEFDVGEGRTRPVQLALVPMLLLLPPAIVPLLIAGGLLLARLPGIASRREGPDSLLPALADGWFSVAPALVLAAFGIPHALWLQVAVMALAVAGQICVDFVVATLRLRIGLGLDVRDQLSGFAWVYLVDVLLTPVAGLAGVAGMDSAQYIAAVVCLTGLLAVFAGERRGRIENALELHRVVTENEQRLQALVQNSSDLIVIVGRDGTIRTLTGAVESIFGLDRAAPIGTRLHDRVHPDDVALLTAFLARVAADAPGGSQALDWRIRHADGGFRYVETIATNLLDDEHLEGIVLTARDVDDRKAFEEQLRHRAFHDPLTQLANRALFYDRIEHALSRVARAEQRVAILFVDLDDFKVTNDELGHAVGDEVLVGVARRLRGCLRSADTAARLGGDEFGVLLESVSGTNEPVQAADRIVAAFCEPIVVHGEAIRVTPSLGLTVSQPGVPDVDELLRQADVAMYEAKRHGKNRWQLYDPELEQAGTITHGAEPERTTWFQRGAEQREQILSLLRRPDAVVPVFQPVLDLRTGLVAGFEALSRFSAAEVRPPNAWFAQAHRCGLGFELEAKALAAALAVPGRPDKTYLTLNLSPSALASDAVQARLPARLDGLVIEVTENELATDDPGFTAALDDVRARGGRIAVDDAGAGYAGLKHVMRLAPDLIKLDRSLVAGIDADPARAALISSFVRFARDSDATVCAEGIETLDELVRLADLDVTYGQGYVIARPAPRWPTISPEAAEACALSFTASLAGDARAGTGDIREHAFEGIVRAVASARTFAELDAAKDAIAHELRADQVTLFWQPPDAGELLRLRRAEPPAPVHVSGGVRETLTTRRITQIVAGDPTAPVSEAAELAAGNWGSLLRLPLVWHDRVVGILEVHSRRDRPWSRFDIRRARMLTHQMAAALDSIVTSDPDRGDAQPAAAAPNKR